MADVRVGTEEELRQEGMRLVQAGGMELGVYYAEGGYYAWRNMCPHAAAPVCRGRIGGTTLPSDVYEYRFGCEQMILRCPWHGWEFDLRTGKHLTDPAIRLRGYPLEVRDGEVFVVLK